MADANTEWCVCGHHDNGHDLDSEPGSQDCSAPGCKCLVFRSTGNEMPDIVLLNEFGTGLDEDGNVIDEDQESILDEQLPEAEELEKLAGPGELVADMKEQSNGEEEVGEADTVDAGEAKVGTFDENGQEIERAGSGSPSSDE